MPRLFLMLLISAATALPGCGSEKGADDPYAVYSALLRMKYGDENSERIVVCLQTYCEESLKENDFGDFAERNREAARLEARFDSDLNVVLVENSKLQLIIGEPSGHGWDRFYRLYPKSRGITRLSGVGFNGDRTQALVYYDAVSGPLSGAGYLVTLSRDGRGWIVAEEHMVWIS